MRPISIRMLPDTATYRPVASFDENGVATFGTDVALTRVRVEAIKKQRNADLGEQSEDKFLLMFDTTNSRPTGQGFTKNDRIVFDSVELTIRQVEKLTDKPSHVHHYEVYLT